MKINSKRALLLVTVASIALAGEAHAQDGGASPSPQADVEDQELVVTGSRIITNGNNSPTPVTVLSVEEVSRTTPSNIADGLNKLPAFANPGSQRTTNNPSTNSVGNYLNLRGIGPLRTLILFDGHRVPGTAQTGEVDVNTIPQLLLQRVDVVTGGASAVYGSDAVTGVVNFVVDRNFNGLKGLAQAGISDYGDGASQRLGIAGGTSLFGGRGHIEASYEFFNSESIDSKLARPLGRGLYGTQGQGTAASPFRLFDDVRFLLYTPGGRIQGGPVAGQQFIEGGVIAPFAVGSPTGTANIVQGGDGTFIKGGLTASLRSHQGFARFDYELTDNIDFYIQGSATRSTNSYVFAQPSYIGVTFSTSNPFLSPAAQAALSAGGATTFQLNKRVDSRLYRSNAATQNYFGNVGFKGNVGDGIDWQLAYTHSQTKQRVEVPTNINRARFAAASDAVRDPSGQIVCNVTLTNPGLYPGCVPLNPFGPNSESDAAFAYVTGPTFYNLRNKMDDFFASVSGSPFSTWAGPVKMALTGEHRRMSILNVSNAEPTARPDCTGLRFNCAATSLIYFTNIVASARGRQNVTEGAFEIDVPLLADVPFFQSLNVNGAVRLADYSTSGNATTWKVGVDWHLNDDIRFRATRSRDFRAPTLNDLFAPINVSPTGYTDLHTGVAQAVQIASQGNSSLRPEVADTLTVGAVYSPGWAPGLSASVDFYRIRIKDAITTVSGADLSIQRLCENSNGTAEVCALYDRPLPFSDRTPANFPTRIYSQALNVSTLKQSGIDAELNYRVPVGPGNLKLRALVSHVWQQDTQQFEGAPVIKYAGVAGIPVPGGLGVPKWRVTGFVQYQLENFSIDVQQRWRSALKQSGDSTLVYDIPKVPTVGYTDLTLTWDADKERRYSFFVSAENLFNKTSPLSVTALVASTPSFVYPVANGDDVMGRYFTAGVRVRY